ncbi:MAG: aldo/keto reductase [Clostridiales bacterium]|jgi:predicted aldo/keto reductase-like oxidoreductase|nr:aldo/keto reductase [Clostridiales bacterium]
METRNYKNTREKVSLLGFGCMRLPILNDDAKEIDTEKAGQMVDYAIKNGINYFDTAYPYHNGMSEIFTGNALSKYPRESFNLATKMPPWKIKNSSDLEEIFEEQLKKCSVDYFDYYLIHSIAENNWDNIKNLKFYEFLTQKKQEGKIRHFGFSFHGGLPLFKEVTEKYEWDFAQIQLNYLDWELQDAENEYKILNDKGIPVIVMEPIRGGTLANLSEKAEQLFKKADPNASTASWAIRFAASLPGVLTVLSGMSKMSQMEDNIRTISNYKPLTNDDRKVIAEVLLEYRSSSTIPCTACRYCMDCPAGVDIPKVLGIFNQYNGSNKMSFLMQYDRLEMEKQAHNCVKCNQCVERCPQGINIPLEMERIAELVNNLKSNK